MHVRKQRLFSCLVLLLALLRSTAGQAEACLRLSGMVQDYATQQPLQAKLFVKMPTGRVAVGHSSASSGQFTVDINCLAVALIVEQVGYQSQQVSLASLSALRSTKQLGVIIPLLMLGSQAKDQVYQQAVQTHYEQQAMQPTGQVQRGLFVVTDALSNQPLSARACLFSTNGQPKRCFDTDKRGQFNTAFTQQDIVAVEVKAAGYQSYQGNIAIEQLDGQQHHHTIQLLRELALITVAIPTAWRSVRCSMQAGDGLPATSLKEVPTLAGQYCTYKLLPGTYQLIIQDVTGQTRHRQTVRVQYGLNVIPLSPANSLTAVLDGRRPTPDSPALAPEPNLHRLPAELPLIYFEQGSYRLTDVARESLQQVSTFMQAHPEYRLKLIGHTDPEGDEQMNRYLSEFRSKIIANHLFWQGIPEHRMSITGQGSRYPVAPSDVEANKAKNRRVFLKLELANE